MGAFMRCPAARRRRLAGRTSPVKNATRLEVGGDRANRRRRLVEVQMDVGSVSLTVLPFLPRCRSVCKESASKLADEQYSIASQFLFHAAVGHLFAVAIASVIGLNRRPW